MKYVFLFSEDSSVKSTFAKKSSNTIIYVLSTQESIFQKSGCCPKNVFLVQYVLEKMKKSSAVLDEKKKDLKNIERWPRVTSKSFEESFDELQSSLDEFYKLQFKFISRYKELIQGKQTEDIIIQKKAYEQAIKCNDFNFCTLSKELKIIKTGFDSTNIKFLQEFEPNLSDNQYEFIIHGGEKENSDMMLYISINKKKYVEEEVACDFYSRHIHKFLKENQFIEEKRISHKIILTSCCSHNAGFELVKLLPTIKEVVCYSAQVNASLDNVSSYVLQFKRDDASVKVFASDEKIEEIFNKKIAEVIKINMLKNEPEIESKMNFKGVFKQ